MEDGDTSGFFSSFTPPQHDDLPELPQTDDLRISRFLQLYVFFLFMFQSLFRLSDTALNVLLSFLALFCKAVSQKLTTISQLLTRLPKNLHAARQLIHLRRDPFQKFVCCPACHSVYTWEQCIVKLPNGDVVSKKCSHVQFPCHPQVHRRKACGTYLMKKIKTRTGNVTLYPHRIYCYRSVIDSLQELLKRPGFCEKCEAWRGRFESSNVYSDIYDGKVWKSFMECNGRPFLSLPFNFGFYINVDWFQPYEHTQHSEGVIYMTVMNLPRSERFLQENIMLIGVIPGPHEPPLNINTYLRPLVDELQRLWQGVTLKTSEGVTVLVRGALLCAGCDIPAARKTCGFMGHRAKKGCSKCYISFPTNAFGEKADYSNFDRATWEARTACTHRRIALSHCNSNTKTQQQSIEQDTGVRYSVLTDLPYFDAPKMCVIDPMHNLLLGTAKHMVELWKGYNILSDKDFATVQERVDSFTSLPDVGRVPMKISSAFSGFTAQQWKNFTIFFSLFAMKGILPPRHYNCWHLFVKACYLFCRRTITEEQLEEADKCIMQFCQSVCDLYGKQACTINMHLHGHLIECIREYGPVYSFWLFPFERMNGVMGSYHTNGINISLQFARRFFASNTYAPYNWPAEFVDDFFPILQGFSYQRGDLMQVTLEAEISSSKELSLVPLPPIQECALSSWQVQSLRPILDGIVGSISYDVLVIHQKAKAVQVGKCFVLGAKGSRHSNSSVVLAKRDGNIFLAEIQFFIQCTTLSNSGHKYIWVAAISWFMEHHCKVWFGNPCQVWSITTYPGYSFIPLSDIVSRVVYTKSTVDFGRVIGTETVFVVVPLNN